MHEEEFEEEQQVELKLEQKLTLERFKRSLPDLSREELEHLAFYTFEQSLHQDNRAAHLYGHLTGIAPDNEILEIWVKFRDSEGLEGAVLVEDNHEDGLGMAEVNQAIQQLWDLD